MAADYIESNMTGGTVSVQKDMIPVIKYQPKGTDKEMPLYVASSIVAEISPLLLLFKLDINFKTLIIEEPEAHLHPELQQKMARLIINIVNRGVPVWVATHGDTMIQHVNNMIKLKENTKSRQLMNEYGYTKYDLLSENNVKMYQFVQNGKGKTRLENLKCEKYGFVVPTFNDSLSRLVSEVYAFQED
jgi:AAA15 family ATPase/GTPase